LSFHFFNFNTGHPTTTHFGKNAMKRWVFLCYLVEIWCILCSNLSMKKKCPKFHQRLHNNSLFLWKTPDWRRSLKSRPTHTYALLPSCTKHWIAPMSCAAVLAHISKTNDTTNQTPIQCLCCLTYTHPTAIILDFENLMAKKRYPFLLSHQPYKPTSSHKWIFDDSWHSATS